MMNRTLLVGRLVKDPELRYTPNGVANATFTLAVNRPFKNKQGDQEADFVNIVVWRVQAENAANFLKKGSLAGVDGRIQTRNYEKDGRKVYVTEVVAESVQFLEPKGSNQQQQKPFPEQQQSDSVTVNNNDPFAKDGQPINISDDDLPF